MNTTEWTPGRLLEVSGGYWQTCALHAAGVLDIFTIISNEQLTDSDIAKKLKASRRGVTMLLNALAAMNLLTKTGEKYSNSAASTAYLSTNSAQYMGHMIKHHRHLVSSWSQLDQAIKTGRPVRGRSSYSEDEWRESFLMGMFNMAMHLAPQVAAKLNLSNRKKLLDLGGGPGTYAIHFCLKNPLLRAVIYDLPTTRPFAQKTIEQFGLADRIDFIDGDYLKESISGRFDAAWLSHILHGEGPEDCQNIIQKTVSALEPGGMIIIHEFIMNDTMDGPLFPALFSLNMLLGTEEGCSYSEKQLIDMLSKAGAKKIERLPFQCPNDSGIITAIA